MFETLLTLSLGGAVMALGALALDFAMRGRTPARLLVWVWAAVLLRLCLPLPSPLPIAAADLPQLEVQLETLPISGVAASPAGEAPARGESALPLAALWLIGAGAACARQFVPYFRLRRRIMRLASEPDAALAAEFSDMYGGGRLRLVQSAAAAVPMTMGIIRPVLVIPEGSRPSEELRFALRHELEHYRRGDLALKWLAAIAVCLHWMNPAAYLASRRLSRCCELACDSAVVRDLAPDERRRYGETLLGFACREPETSPLSAGMSHGQTMLRERLVNIMKYKKASPAILSLTILLFAALILCGVFLGPRVSAAEPEAETPVITDVEAPAASDGESAVWPVPGFTDVSSPFGTRVHPVFQKEFTHDGMDIVADEGEPVLAVMAGAVLETGFDADRGNFVRIEHSDGLVTLYAQMSEIAVAAGDAVGAGEQIGSVGNTGHSTGAHLHLGLEKDGEYADPASLFAD